MEAATQKFRFLVLGAGRGGTSLLAGLLDFHPCIEVAFERCFVAHLLGGELPWNGFDVFGQRAEAFKAACLKMAGESEKPIWGNKITTEQVFGLEEHNEVNSSARMDVLERFFDDSMRGVKVIFILRDGRACVDSKVRRSKLTYEDACKNWRYSVRCYRFFQEQHDNNLRLRYEDLVMSPEPTLARICDFLDVPFDPRMLEGTANSKMLPDYINEKIDVSRIAGQRLPEGHLASIANELAYCGYN